MAASRITTRPGASPIAETDFPTAWKKPVAATSAAASACSAAALAPQTPAVDEFALGDGRSITGVVEIGVPDRGRDGEIHVVADEVHEFERTHAEAAGVADDRVDRRDIGRLFLVKPQGLGIK